MSEQCETEGCSNHAQWQLSTQDKQRQKQVCTKCRDELMSVYLWELTGIGTLHG